MIKKCFFVMLCLIFSVGSVQFTLADNLFEYRTLANVNFRTGPSTEDDVIETFNFGSVVLVIDYDDSEDGWSQIVYNDAIGYIKTEFLGTEEDLAAIEALFVQDTVSSAELLEWSKVKNMFTIGVPVEVYDVYTGLTYHVKSFSNGLHADVEPVTKEDTAIMKRTFGNVWSWDVRPVLVTINGREIAASINGMPHGGGVNSSNGMDGQVCIHFLGSTTHNGNKSYAKLHQDYVYTAYNMSK